MDSQLNKKSGLIKGLAISLAMSLALIVWSIVLSIIVISQIGGVEHWLNWRHDNYSWLLTWRICVYVLLTTFWVKLKGRMPPLEPGPARNRVRRAELLVALLCVIVEFSKAPVAWGELL